MWVMGSIAWTRSRSCSLARILATWVLTVASLAGLALAGVAIAVAGALLPATWGAGSSTSSVLRAE